MAGPRKQCEPHSLHIGKGPGSADQLKPNIMESLGECQKELLTHSAETENDGLHINLFIKLH